MATLGDTTEPTNTAEAHDDAYISFGHVLSMPSGGPWNITDIAVWIAGYGENSTCRNVVWSGSTGATLVETGTYTAVQRSFTASGSDLYDKPCTPYNIAGGSSIIVGVRRNAGHAIFFGRRSTGSHRENDLTTMVGNDTHVAGAMGAYITYELANSAPNAPTTLTPTGGVIITGADLTPALSFLYTDPDGDNMSAFEIELDNNSDFSSPVWDSGKVARVQAHNTTVFPLDWWTPPGNLVRGTLYYWRARVWDASDTISAWSA